MVVSLDMVASADLEPDAENFFDEQQGSHTCCLNLVFRQSGIYEGD
jgi:hypothetical protein